MQDSQEIVTTHNTKLDSLSGVMTIDICQRLNKSRVIELGLLLSSLWNPSGWMIFVYIYWSVQYMYEYIFIHESSK